MTDTARAFRGVRVLELAAREPGIAVAVAGWQLGAMGARVTQLTAASPRRGNPRSPVALARDVLADGKLKTPSPVEPAAFQAMISECDILLSDSLAELEASVGPVESLRETHPDLVIGIATTFGLHGPHAGLKASALDAQAVSGMAWALGEPGREPLTLPPGVSEHQSGAMLAAGCLLALLLRDAGMGGRLVDISLADVLASYVAGGCRYFVHHGLTWERSGRRASGSGGAYPFTILPCKDGLVCICGRTRDEWDRFVQVMGNPDWASEPRYRKLRAMGREYPDEVDALIMPWLAKHTMAELEAIALENGLIVAPLRDLAEVLETPHFAARGSLSRVWIGEEKVLTPGLPFHITTSRSEGADNLAGELLSAEYQRAEPVEATPASPLAGLRVLDLGWVWSAPWVSTMLCELGAEVIKVEHAKRPDNLRLAGRIVRNGAFVEGPSMEMSPMYHQVNHGKLGITLNIKEPEAAVLLKRLVSMSDIVIENMSPGSLERAGLGYQVFNELNSRIIVLAMSVAGQFGALTKMRAYAPTMSSFVGMESLVGYDGEAPIGTLNLGLSDPSASVHAMIPLLAALRRARATGRGCYIDFAQIEALLGTLRPYILEAQVSRHQPRPMGNRNPERAPHGIYPTRGEDTWITLTADGDAEWWALTGIAASRNWEGDGRFATARDRLANAALLDEEIAAWTRTLDRDVLIARLREAGLACFAVQSVEELWRDPHFTARRMKQTVDIPIYGKEVVFKAPWRFSDFGPEITRQGPATGEHNELVFGELLGMTSTEISDLRERGVIA